VRINVYAEELPENMTPDRVARAVERVSTTSDDERRRARLAHLLRRAPLPGASVSYPALDKLIKVAPFSQKIGEFLDWLSVERSIRARRAILEEIRAAQAAS
jgi:hypothetical protein